MKQFARIFVTQSEVNDFVSRHSDKAGFHVESIQVHLCLNPANYLSPMNYVLERYAMLYLATEALS